jgi:ABC-2 type transport system permease protein
MSEKYNQFQAMLAITKASLVATFRSPQAIFFSLFFPLVLIWIFGSLGGNGTPAIDVAFEKGVDTGNIVYQVIKHHPVLNFKNDNKNKEDELKKGRLAAIINIVPVHNDTETTYAIQVKTSAASQKDVPLLQSVLKTAVNEMDHEMHPDQKSFATITQKLTYHDRPYRMIDFFLPGMIGFALIGSAVFGIAFLLYSLRETLVLKRMYSTPIKKQYIILGESLAKVIFNLMTVVVLIAFGHWVYGFYLAEGWITFLDMLIISFLALLIFMGFGFFISSVSKNQNVIPIYANLFMFPQYFLSGTFFPKTSLPAFLQPFIKFLPLTAVNDALRNVAFEGASLASCWPQILILLVWGLIIYTATAKVFRWE